MRILPILLCILTALAAACSASEPGDGWRPTHLNRDTGELVFAPNEIAGIDLADSEPAEPAEGDIGQSEQPLIFPKNGAGNPGIKPGSYRSCESWDNGQNCVVPYRATLVWFPYDGTNAQKTEIRTHVNQWITDMVAMGLDQCSQQRCWKFREATSLDDPDLDLVIAIGQSSSGACPGSAGTTRDLICWGGSTTSLTKASGQGLFGTFHRFADHIVPVATVDYAQVQNTPGLTANQKFMRTRQAVRAILLGYGGKGLAQIGNSRCNNVDLLPLDEMCVEAQSEVCWFENLGDAGDPYTIRRLGPDCGS